MASTTKTIVTVTPPITAVSISRLSTATTTSVSPTSLTSLSLTSAGNFNSNSSNLNTATTSQNPTTSKHCTFSLTPITIPPPPNKVSFLSTAKFHKNSINSNNSTIAHSSPSNTVNPAAVVSAIKTPSTPSTPAIAQHETGIVASTNSHTHANLEMRRSAASQITTVEDVDEICKFPLTDESTDADVHLHYSTSSSSSSLSLNSSAVVPRDNIIL